MRVIHLFLIAFVIFLGCSSQITSEVNCQTISPPPFSFLDKDPNNILFEHVERMKRYDEILKSSPVPVFVIEQKDLPDIYNLVDANGKEKKYFGLYVPSCPIPQWPKTFIFLEKTASVEQIMTSFFHETQHHTCRLTECACKGDEEVFGPNDTVITSILSEKHAILNEFHMGWKLKDSYLLNNSFLLTVGYITRSDSITYKAAGIGVTEEEIWNKTVNYLADLEFIFSIDAESK
jgi:hypothetical protein